VCRKKKMKKAKRTRAGKVRRGQVWESSSGRGGGMTVIPSAPTLQFQVRSGKVSRRL
jgi:hypothetical protein